MGFSVLHRIRKYCCDSAAGCIGGGRMMSSVRMSPWLMLSPSFDDDSRSVEYKFHSVGSKEELICGSKSNSINLNEMEFAGSSHGWLALYNWRNDDVFLSNPISGGHIKLPPLHTVTEVLHGVSRVALSCSPEGEGCRAMMTTVGPARRLALCVPGRSTDLIGSREYEDVVYSSRHELFFCITTTTELEGWNVGDPRSPRIDWRVQLKLDRHADAWPSQCWHLKYLVFAEQSDDLFLVVRHVNPRMRRHGSVKDKCTLFSKFRGADYSHPYKTIDFDVYKIDREGGGKLMYMKESLEGLAIFVGINQSFAVSASDFPELKPNSVYFADENRLIRLSRSDVHNEYGGHDNGIFNYQNSTFASCCANSCPLNPLVYGHITRIHPPPLWFANLS